MKGYVVFCKFEDSEPDIHICRELSVAKRVIKDFFEFIGMDEEKGQQYIDSLFDEKRPSCYLEACLSEMSAAVSVWAGNIMEER